MDISIPEDLLRDRYWGSFLHIILNHYKLKNLLQYVDFNRRLVNTKGMLSISKPWSESERFMLSLALHLFNPMFKVDLSGMDDLDKQNKHIAMKAIWIRYGS